MSTNSNTLYICPTPIGNLGDISKRLNDVLTSVDFVFAEDTRVSAKLLNHIGSKASLRRLDENVIKEHGNDVIDLVSSGHDVAYCSDAGVPGVSDPGLQLVSLARTSGIECSVLPGPCAAINAYVASGFNNSKFYFGGFLPRKKNEIVSVLESLDSLDAILIFYESPKRLVNSLKTIAEFKKDIEVSVCRELTKLHEEIVVSTAADIYSEFSSRDSVKGECVVCINNSQCDNMSDDQVINTQKASKKLVLSLLDEGVGAKAAAKITSSTFDISKNDAYKIALELSK